MNKIFSELAVVILFWNNSEKTIKCLNSIFNKKKLKLNIVLVDNNSEKKYSNDIIHWLHKKKIRLIKIKKNHKIQKNKLDKICYYIKNDENYGCGLGHNPGYEFCLNNKFKYIARIDNDMIVPKNTIFNLVKRLESNKKIIAVSPKVMFAQKPKLVWWRGSEIGNNLKFQRNCASYSAKGHLDQKKFKGLIKTDAICGCASIMRSEKLKETGLSDPEFFYGEEDTELSIRLIKNGGYLMADLNERIYHHISLTVGTNWSKNIYYNYKYRLLLIKKIGTISDKIFGYSFAILKLLLSLLFVFNLKNSSKIIQRYYAIKHFLQNKFGDFDRKNYIKINKYFCKINKKTNVKDLIRILDGKNRI